MNHDAALKAICSKEINSKGKAEEREIEENTDTEKINNKNLERGDKIRLKLEEDQKIAAAILEKRKLEEEEYCLIKKEAEKRRVDELEQEKRRLQKMKIDQLIPNKIQDTNAKVDNLERPKIMFSNNPLIRKFEELALIALNEKQLQKDLQTKKIKHRVKKHSVLNRSKQILTKVARKLKGSQNISETSEETNAVQCGKVNDGEEKKKEMQNYLISQVLFNGKEDVQSVPIREEDYTKEYERQVDFDKFELKKEEAFFEAYKQNMEEYLDFVCEENKSKGKAKKKTTKSNKVNQNCTDIKLMKRQFENQKDDNKQDKDNLKTNVGKLSSSKLCFKDKSEQNIVGLNKTYVPVIIDKEAFERTVGLFEVDKQKEEADNRLAEMKLKKKELMDKVKCELKDLGIEPRRQNKKKQKIFETSKEKENIIQKNEEKYQKDEVVPKWISVYLEKSKKNVSEEKVEIKEEEYTEDLYFSKEYEQKIQPMLDLIDDNNGGNQKQTQITLKLDRNNTESFNQRKEAFEGVNEPGKNLIVESKIKNHPGFLDKMSKIKAMLSNGGSSSTTTSATKKIPSKDTSIIKGKYENKFSSSNSEKDIEIYRPKKKLIDVPNIVDEFKGPLEKTEKKWKWKQPNNSQPAVEDNKQEEELVHSKLELESSAMEDEVLEIEKEIDQIKFVEEFINDSSFKKNQMDVETIQAYLDLIEERHDEETISSLTPERYFHNTMNLDTIKDKLSTGKLESKTQQKEVGKVSHNFENINNENQMPIKEKERYEPKKDVTKMKKHLFESHEKKKNIISSPQQKVKRKLVEDPFQKSQNQSVPERKNTNQCKFNFSTTRQKEGKSNFPLKLSQSSSLQSLPTRNQTASISKLGENNSRYIQKRAVEIRTYSDSDLDDILNYENSEEISNYEKQLRDQYSLEESDSSQESICKEENKKTDSFANLMNILSVMRKTNLSKSVSNSKNILLENMNQKKTSGSQIDMSDISGIHQSLRSFYEKGTQNIDLQKETIEDKISINENTVNKESLLEKLSPKNKEPVKKIFEKMNTEQSQRYENNPGMKKAISCRDISWGRVSSELDEETMLNISESKQSAMEMFESAAPKYKFGGSLSKINDDKKVSKKQNMPVIKQVKQEYDERKWVLDSINKHFDVILEEEEDESDSAYDDSDGEECWSDSEEEYEEQKAETGKKSSVAMQGLLKSVVSKIRKSCSNLDDKDVICSLKSQLEQR